MQEDAAEKLDELLTPIDVSNEIKHLEEQLVTYNFQLGEMDKNE
jgi:hypothetical protein